MLNLCVSDSYTRQRAQGLYSFYTKIDLLVSNTFEQQKMVKIDRYIYIYIFILNRSEGPFDTCHTLFEEKFSLFLKSIFLSHVIIL